MIDADNLRTASLYINNQLLSRGLLRDGQSIDFADPEMGDGGLQATMGRVMSVVNDLILRRDRDAEHRESLSTTLRGLRAESQRQTTEFARQSDKLQDTQRRLDGSEATERALRIQLKTAESHIHKLKEEMVRLKALVAQTRSACANEVRKRDRQIDSLKRAVTDAGRVRGGGKSRDVMTISVVGEVGAGMGEDGVGSGVPAGATDAEGYSLRMETNEFLTELARGLSEENEGLLTLVKRTVDGLREMSGLDRNGESINGHDSHNGNFSVQPPHKSAEELAAELEAIVEHLRTILTNPSFVPIEEVEVREEAINRLRAGLETMEERWKDAVQLIDGWRRRMVSSGKSVDVEDLQMGLRLSPVRVRNVEETSHVVPLRLPCVHEEDEEEEEEEEEQGGAFEQDHKRAQEPPIHRSPSPAESLHLVPAPGYEAEENDEDSDSYSSIFQDDAELDDLDVEEPNVQILQASTTRDSSPPLPEPPQLSPLKDSYSSGNKRSGNNPPIRKRPGDFTTIVEENTWDLVAAEQEPEEPAAPQPQAKRPKSPKHRPAKLKLDQQQSRPTSSDSAYDSPLFGKSGERPSLSPPSRKLFSKPSAPASAPVSAPATGPAPAPAPATAPIKQPQRTAPRSQPEPEPSQPTRRVTRAAARKSQEAPASPSTTSLPQSKTRSSHKRTSSDPSPKKESAPARTGTPTRPRASKSTSSPKSTSGAAAFTAVAISTTAPAPTSPTKPQQSPQRTTTSRSPVRRETVPPTTVSSRLPRRNNPPPPQQSPLTMATIAAKLAASEREADAARVRAKLRALRKGGRTTTPAVGNEEKTEISVQAEPSQLQALPEEDVDPVKKDLDPPPRLSGSTSLSRSQKQRQKCEDQGQARPTSRGKSLNGSAKPKTNGATADDDDMDELALGNDNTSANPNISPSRSRRVIANQDNTAAVTGTPKAKAAAAAAASEDLNEAMSKAKRRRDRRSSKVASVRRSTLSPWELESLIQGNVPPSPSMVESPAR